MSAWTDHVERWKDCTDCPLCEQRDRIVLARGTVPCDVLFIGEAPGASEDARGIPFDGPAGTLLDQIIERAIPKGVPVAMTNLVACFPRDAKLRGDNEPERDEILACRERLVEFVNIARPRLIVCVGTLSAEYVIHHDIVQCIDIVHPAFILKRLPLAQKRMAIDKAIVVVKNAVEDMLQSKHTNFTKWGDSYASTQVAGHRTYVDDIPF